MNILVSACLLGIPCRYDASAHPHCAVLALAEQGHRLIPVCPEGLGGLPTPRSPAEIRGSRVVSREGEDVTAQYRAGAEETLRMAQREGCTWAVFKERSPSCGCKGVYDGSFTGLVIPGQGLAARLLTEHGIQVLGESEVHALTAEES